MTVASKRDGPVSLVDRVLTLVENRILSGEYEPGARLRLQTLADECGASLIPVREALRILEAERLVETIPNRGARVAAISQVDMEDLYRIRILLESQAVRWSPLLSTEEAEYLTELLEQLKVASVEENRSEVLRLHREYHFGIYDRTGSQWLIFVIDLLWKHTERYQRLSLHVRHDAADHEHRAVLKELAAGDNDAAAEALRRHLETTAKLVGDAYQNTHKRADLDP